MGAAHKFIDALRTEVPISDFIPYSSHVTKHIVRLRTGDYVATLRLQGAAHESADAQDINVWHAQLNNWARNIASPNVALWSHVVRRDYNDFPDGAFSNPFARELNERYRQHLAGQRSLINELYLSIVYRPQPTQTLRFLELFDRPSEQDRVARQRDEIQALTDILDTTQVALDRYEPELLGCYEHCGQMFSQLQEFLAYLLDGEWRRQPLARGVMAHTLGGARPFFGKGGLMSVKGPTRLQYAALLAIQEYPAVTCPGLLNELLGLPFEFTLTQSFCFLSKAVALGRMKRQHARMAVSDDVALSQREAIEQAMDELASGHFVMGTHHLTLMIRAASQKDLAESVADAGSALSDAGIKWAREDIGIAGSYWAQLPGNAGYRVRLGDISSRNFAGLSCFHNWPLGHIRHNQWGPAVTAFRTTSGAPYYFSWHKGEDGDDAKRAARLDPNHKDLGNALIIGQAGSGKTVLQLFLAAQSQKFCNPGVSGGNRLSTVFFDKGLGASIGIRAMGGRYFALRNGVPSGWNPLQLDPTELNLVFLERLIRRLVQRTDQPLRPSEEREIYAAIQGVMGAPKPLRRLGAVLQFLPQGDPDGIHARLSRWVGKGPLAWLFDNTEDTLDVDVTPILGFDMTEFLANDETREPTMMYLWHRIERLLDGRRVAIFIDEFGELIKDATFQDLVQTKLVTIRKQDGIIVMGTQMPEQLIHSPIAAAVIQQTATKIFLPNPAADHDHYVHGLKLTEREFEIVQSLGEKSRQFLIKQGRNSVVAEFRLRGFEDELAVLSGNTATSALAERLMAQLGDDPQAWLPEFHRIRKAA